MVLHIPPNTYNFQTNLFDTERVLTEACLSDSARNGKKERFHNLLIFMELFQSSWQQIGRAESAESLWKRVILNNDNALF